MSWSTVGGGGGGTGDVDGPASSVNNNFVQFDGTTGKLLKDGGLALDTDGTLAANSDLKVPSQKAVKTYAEQILAAADAMVFKGSINASANPNYPAADAGHTYRFSVAGKIGGGSGPNVEINDTMTCLVDGSVSGTQAAVGANWDIVQANLDGAVIGPVSSTDGAITLFDGVSGKLIKNGGVGIALAGSRVLYVDKNRTDSYTEDGTIFRPFKTVAGAVAVATTHTVIKIAQGNYAEDITLSGLVEVVLDGSGGDTSIRSLVISGSTTKVFVYNLRIQTGSTSVTALTYTDGSNCQFINCQFRMNPAGGGSVPPITIAGTTANPPVFKDCAVYNDGTAIPVNGSIGGAGTSVQFLDCYFGEAPLTINGFYSGYLVGCTGIGAITHAGVALVMSLCQANSIASTATLAGSGLLALDNVTLRQENLSVGIINKTGNCVFILADVDYDYASSTLTGSRYAFNRNSSDIANRSSVSGASITDALNTLASGTGANTSLSNLAAVAINAALIPATAGALDIGSAAKPWADIHMSGTSATPATNRFRLTGASTGGLRTITFQNASGTVAFLSDIVGVGNSLALGSGAEDYFVCTDIPGLTGTGNLVAGNEAGLNLTSATNNTLYGTQAGKFLTTEINNTYIGFQSGSGASNTGSNNTTLGRGTGVAITTASGLVLVGASTGGAITTGSYNTVLGFSSAASLVTGVGNILLGAEVNVPSGGSLSNTFVAGSGNYPINDIYFGKGVSNGTPTAVNYRGTDGIGSNIAGGGLNIVGGRSTGNAAGGSITFGTSPAGGPGSSQNSATTWFTINSSGQFVFTENAQLQYDSTLSADGKWSGRTEEGTAAATLAFGDLVYLNSSGKWNLVDADTEGTSGPVRLGMVILSAASADDPTRVLLEGNIRADSRFPTFTIGATLFASTTAGDVSTTAPSGSGDVVRAIGSALSADSFDFIPSNEYLVLV